MLTESNKRVIKESWRVLGPIGATLADQFFKRLFELKPEYQKLFTGDLAAHKRQLLAILGFIVQALDWPESAWDDEVNEEDDLFLVVLALGRRHSELYKLPDASYATVGEALLWALDFGLGRNFDDASRTAWTKVYTLVSNGMKMGRFSVRSRNDIDRAIDRVISPRTRS